MIACQTKKRVPVTQPAAIIDNASAATTVIDTAGFDFVEVVVWLGALDIAVSTMKLQESDDSGMSGATDVPGHVFGTSTNSAGATSTLPSATDDGKFYSFYVDARARKRYLDLVLTLGDGSTGTFCVAWAELWLGETIPSTAAGRGAAQELIG